MPRDYTRPTAGPYFFVRQRLVQLPEQRGRSSGGLCACSSFSYRRAGLVAPLSRTARSLIACGIGGARPRLHLLDVTCLLPAGCLILPTVPKPISMKRIGWPAGIRRCRPTRKTVRPSASPRSVGRGAPVGSRRRADPVRGHPSWVFPRRIDACAGPFRRRAAAKPGRGPCDPPTISARHPRARLTVPRLPPPHSPNRLLRRHAVAAPDRLAPITRCPGTAQRLPRGNSVRLHLARP